MSRLRLTCALLLVALAVVPAAHGRAERTLAGRTVVLDPGHNGGNWTHPAAIAHEVWAGTHYKPCDTFANQQTRFIDCHCGAACDFENHIQRIGNIGRGFNQRAIKIKKQRIHGQSTHEAAASAVVRIAVIFAA